MMQMVKNSGNPSAAISSMAQSNPDVKNTIEMINGQYGGDAKAAFMAKAKSMGIDPNVIINQLNS